MLQIVDPAIIGGAVAVGLFSGIVAFLMLGRQFGRIAHERHGGTAAGIGSLEAAVFALMGLLIAFTFSGAAQRFDQRRLQVVDEANAIGTAWLRIDLLPPAAQPQVREDMRAYVDARIATYRKLPDVKAATGELARSQQLQTQLWKRSLAAARLPGAVPAAETLLLPALNQMFDLASARVAAMQMHPPNAIYVMLFGLALAAALLAGYQSGADRRPDWLHKFGFATIVSLTIYVILDLEYPRLGWIRIEAIDELLAAARASMN